MATWDELIQSFSDGAGTLTIKPKSASAYKDDVEFIKRHTAYKNIQLPNMPFPCNNRDYSVIDLSNSGKTSWDAVKAELSNYPAVYATIKGYPANDWFYDLKYISDMSGVPISRIRELNPAIFGNVTKLNTNLENEYIPILLKEEQQPPEPGPLTDYYESDSDTDCYYYPIKPMDDTGKGLVPKGWRLPFKEDLGILSDGQHWAHVTVFNPPADVYVIVAEGIGHLVLSGEPNPPVPDPPVPTSDYFTLANNAMPLPAGSYYVSQEFGNAGHRGIDLSTRKTPGIPVYCVQAGVVTAVQAWNGHSTGGAQSWGNMVLINHGVTNGVTYTTRYAHLATVPNLNVGQTVVKGQQLSTAGATGNVTGIHLHLEVTANGTLVNPRNYVPI